MIGVGYLVGFSFQEGLLKAIGVVVLVLAVGFAFSWVSATVGLAIRAASPGREITANRRRGARRAS